MSGAASPSGLLFAMLSFFPPRGSKYAFIKTQHRLSTHLQLSERQANLTCKYCEPLVEGGALLQG